eukprot:UN05254
MSVFKNVFRLEKSFVPSSRPFRQSTFIFQRICLDGNHHPKTFQDKKLSLKDLSGEKIIYKRLLRYGK